MEQGGQLSPPNSPDLEASSKTPEGAVYFLGKLLTLDI